ncbi:MAG: SigF/SigG family RNA polymerase sporulation sigma factor [Clostridia bacterium]|nr:SigF/SigG family RNA polymerase sporulation sigma factor [Clostridia bacterium]
MSDIVKTNEELLILSASGNQTAREQLITQNTPLVHSVVRRFTGRGYETEDLFQIGCIGLLKAVQNFDLSFGVKFSTYAVPMILGEIKRFLRDDGIIKVSRSLKETAAKAMRIREELTLKTGTEPGVSEIAEQLNLSSAELVAALDAGARPESLYAVPEHENRDGLALIDRLECGRDYATEITDRVALRQVLSEFSQRDRQLIQLRYFKHKTQSQVAQVLGISQVQVSRIEKKILLQMRKRMLEETALSETKL